VSDGPLFERAPSSTGTDGTDGSGEGEKKSPPGPEPWSVSAINRQVRFDLERGWGNVWVHGEIADATRAATGHVYFTLNDEEEQAQLKAVMFRSDAQRSRAKLERGERVRVRGKLSLYEPRGNFQMICRSAMPAGEGDLAARFKRLVKKLEAEGVIDPERRRPLPMLPRAIGVVTSEHGAALHDVIRVAAERFPMRIVVAPCRVQGAEAPAEIVAAIQALPSVPDLDVLIVARGGGSAEDLWAFNDEAVARAIAGCPIPVVSGVGHETDVTLADLVADVRAATPSNAAEIVCPEKDVLLERVEAGERGLARALETRIGRGRLQISRLREAIEDPRNLLRQRRDELVEQREALAGILDARLRAHREGLARLERRLATQAPRARLRDGRRRLNEQHAALVQTPHGWLQPSREQLRGASGRLSELARKDLAAGRHALAELAGKLSALSPLSVLSRGYAIALHGETGQALRSESEVEDGDAIELRLHEGRVRARVEK